MKTVKLPEICTIPITDGTHQTPTYATEQDGIPFISSKDVTSKKIDWKNIKYITKELHEQLYKRIAPQKDDLLLAKNGTTGVAALVEDDKIFDIYVTLAVIRPDLEKVFPKYLFHVINSPFCKNQFNSHLVGIGVPNLHLKDINQTEIPLPTLPEQQKIAAELDTIQSAIDNKKQQLSLLDEAVKSEFVEMFGDIHQYEKLSAFSTLITKGASPRWQGIEYTDEGTLFITSENVRERFIDYSKKKFLPDNINDILPRSILKKNDVLINIVGASIGRAAIFDSDLLANINQAVALVRLDSNKIDELFLVTYLNSEKALKMYSEMKKGGARDNLSLQNISDLKIPICDLKSQKKFAALVQQIDKSKFVVKQQISDLQELLDSKMQEYFS